MNNVYNDIDDFDFCMERHSYDSGQTQTHVVLIDGRLCPKRAYAFNDHFQFSTLAFSMKCWSHSNGELNTMAYTLLSN